MNKNRWPYPFINNKHKRGDYSWHETNERIYWDQLEVLPPARMERNAFMVGEPWNFDGEGSIYAAFVEIDNRYFCKNDYLKSLNPERYNQEIKNQFSLD